MKNKPTLIAILTATLIVLGVLRLSAKDTFIKYIPPDYTLDTKKWAKPAGFLALSRNELCNKELTEQYYQCKNCRSNEQKCTPEATCSSCWNATSQSYDLPANSTASCVASSCAYLTSHAQCNTSFSTANCTAIEDSYNSLMRGDSREVSKCFKPIDQNFLFKFVAKSNEKVFVQWQINCKDATINPPSNMSDYNFYSRIKIYKYDEYHSWGPGAPVVYESSIHQKAFFNSFFVNAITAVPGLQIGQTYCAVICYFIPYVGTVDIKMDVASMNLIVQRHRE